MERIATRYMYDAYWFNHDNGEFLWSIRKKHYPSNDRIPLVISSCLEFARVRAELDYVSCLENLINDRPDDFVPYQVYPRLRFFHRTVASGVVVGRKVVIRYGY